MAPLLAVRAWRMLPGLLIQAAVAETLIGFVPWPSIGWPHRGRNLRPRGADDIAPPVAVDVAEPEIRRRRVLGGLINEYDRAARRSPTELRKLQVTGPGAVLTPYMHAAGRDALKLTAGRVPVRLRRSRSPTAGPRGPTRPGRAGARISITAACRRDPAGASDMLQVHRRAGARGLESPAISAALAMGLGPRGPTIDTMFARSLLGCRGTARQSPARPGTASRPECTDRQHAVFCGVPISD